MTATDEPVKAAVRRNHPAPNDKPNFTTVCYECERAVEAARLIIEAQVLFRYSTYTDDPSISRWLEEAAQRRIESTREKP